MTGKKLDDIRACVFDAYGTLFDVHSAVGRHKERLGSVADRVSALWRQKQLEYTWLRSLMARHADFWQVTGEALEYAMATHGVDDDALRGDLMDAYRALACYEEVPGVLRRLSDAGIATAILSNGEPSMLRDGARSAGIDDALDAILSVEDVGIYKPDARVYRLATDRLGVRPEQVAFQSSNAWDVCGASVAGMRVVWINRFGQQRERLPGTADVELESLHALPDLVGA